MTPALPGRSKWRYAEEAKAFHAAHDYAPYVMDWRASIEARWDDEELPTLWRVYEYIKLHANGNLYNYAVTCGPPKKPGDPKPRPLTQTDVARDLHLSNSTVSEAISNLKAMAYLRADTDLLWIEDRQFRSFAPASLRSRSPSTNLSGVDFALHENQEMPPYARFKRQWAAEHPEDWAVYEASAAAIEQLRREIEHHREQKAIIERRILGAFRDLTRLARRNGSRFPKNGGACGVKNPLQVKSASDSSKKDFGTPEGDSAQSEERASLTDSIHEAEGSGLQEPLSSPLEAVVENQNTTLAPLTNDDDGDSPSILQEEDHRACQSHQKPHTEIGRDAGVRIEREISLTLASLGISHDADAIVALRKACQIQAPDCTGEEICFFLHEKAPLARRRTTENPMGLLLQAVPRCLAGEPFRRWRTNRRKELERAQKQRAKQEQDLELFAKYDAWIAAEISKTIEQMGPAARAARLAHFTEAWQARFPDVGLDELEANALRAFETEIRLQIEQAVSFAEFKTLAARGSVTTGSSS